MSDLQCPATVVFIDPDFVGSDRAREHFDGKPLAGLFVVSALALDPAALAEAARFAAARGCPLHTLSDAVDPTSLKQEVEHLSDLYRGETIAVVASLALIRDVLGSTSTPPIRVAIDSSGCSEELSRS